MKLSVSIILFSLANLYISVASAAPSCAVYFFTRGAEDPDLSTNSTPACKWQIEQFQVLRVNANSQECKPMLKETALRKDLGFQSNFPNAVYYMASISSSADKVYVQQMSIDGNAGFSAGGTVDAILIDSSNGIRIECRK